MCFAVFVTKLGHYWETKVQLWRLAPSIVFSCGTACPSAQIMLLSYRAWQIPKQDSKTLKPLACLLLTAELILNVNTYLKQSHTIQRIGTGSRSKQQGSIGCYYILSLAWNKCLHISIQALSLCLTHLLSCFHFSSWLGLIKDFFATKNLPV